MARKVKVVSAFSPASLDVAGKALAARNALDKSEGSWRGWVARTVVQAFKDNKLAMEAPSKRKNGVAGSEHLTALFRERAGNPETNTPRWKSVQHSVSEGGRFLSRLARLVEAGDMATHALMLTGWGKGQTDGEFRPDVDQIAARNAAAEAARQLRNTKGATTPTPATPAEAEKAAFTSAAAIQRQPVEQQVEHIQAIVATIAVRTALVAIAKMVQERLAEVTAQQAAKAGRARRREEPVAASSNAA